MEAFCGLRVPCADRVQASWFCCQLRNECLGGTDRYEQPPAAVTVPLSRVCRSDCHVAEAHRTLLVHRPFSGPLFRTESFVSKY